MTGIDPEWSASESSEGTWPNDPYGRVPRALEKGDRADPSASGVNESPGESMKRRHEELKARHAEE